ncbi:MAG: arginase family protein [Abitibacteriaceae bacterium]|nr:arginase family protein [Abditibacteriaceae bacterium]
MLKLSSRVRILDLDGSVTKQLSLMSQLATPPQVIDLRHLAASLRFMCTQRARHQFESYLQVTQRDHLTFYGSGDFHHLTAALVAQWQTPISLVVFDGHPDWDMTSPWHCCGCWVNEVLAQPHIRKVVVIGLGGTDLHGWHVLRGNLKAIYQQKLELFPARWQQSKTIFGASAALPGVSMTRRWLKTNIRWQTVAQRSLPEIMHDVITRLPTRDVYLSIDKDCLTSDFAITNWEEGELTLPTLCGAMQKLAKAKDIVGVDVIGEWSQGPIHNWLFRWLAKADHPQQATPRTADFKRNEQTNITLYNALLELNGS